MRRWWRSWLFWLNVLATGSFLAAPVYTCAPVMRERDVVALAAWWWRYEPWEGAALALIACVALVDGLALAVSARTRSRHAARLCYRRR